ncbi:MAG: hypothetical protein ACOYMQ_03780 [Pseudanabaena sp.]
MPTTSARLPENPSSLSNSYKLAIDALKKRKNGDKRDGRRMVFHRLGVGL